MRSIYLSFRVYIAKIIPEENCFAIFIIQVPAISRFVYTGINYFNISNGFYSILMPPKIGMWQRLWGRAHSSWSTIIEWHNGNIPDWRYEWTYEIIAFNKQDQLKLHRRNMLVQQLKATDQQPLQMNPVNILSFKPVDFLWKWAFRLMFFA